MKRTHSQNSDVVLTRERVEVWMDEDARNIPLNPTERSGREENVSGNHFEPEWVDGFVIVV